MSLRTLDFIFWVCKRPNSLVKQLSLDPQGLVQPKNTLYRTGPRGANSGECLLASIPVVGLSILHILSSVSPVGNGKFTCCCRSINYSCLSAFNGMPLNNNILRTIRTLSLPINSFNAVSYFIVLQPNVCGEFLVFSSSLSNILLRLCLCKQHSLKKLNQVGYM